MAELKHASHECVLTSPEIVADGICNMCYKDEPVEFACNSCNFDLCKPCSKIPQLVYHDFHSEHSLEFCLCKDDGKSIDKLCSGCGNLFSGSYYKCKEGCEIYLDLDCGILKNIATGWDAEEMLHYSHAHLIRRCRPGRNVKGSCLLCELPLSPSSICYGCVQCNSFVHERCLDFPREIQHPVHPAHPLKRLDFTHICGGGKRCNACGCHIDGTHGIPFGCPKCNFNLHLRCADSLLRGLTHKSHHHKLFYTVGIYMGGDVPCQICLKVINRLNDPYSHYHCVECKFRFHFECLRIPESFFKKSYHIHPLMCKKILPEDDSLEYCGVCETLVHAGHHVYSCEECDFVGHIECILRERAPSPLYLKDLYSCNDDMKCPTDGEDSDEAKELLENKLLITDIDHNHLLTFCGDFVATSYCYICRKSKVGRKWECEIEACKFEAHDYCVKLRQPSVHRFHSNHLLTLLPSYPAGVTMKCDNCNWEIEAFNLFCRICNFIICTKCVEIGNQMFGELQRGQKFIRTTKKNCLKWIHFLIEVMVSRSYLMVCMFCDERLCGEVLSCLTCGDLCHHWCFKSVRKFRVNHPLHSDHELRLEIAGGSKCIACKLSIEHCGYNCSTCKLSFHIKCVKEVISTSSGTIEPHAHFLYNFWMDDNRACSVCGEPCGASFYGCIDCNNFSAHVECIGFPANVKNQQHQHTVEQIYSRNGMMSCSLCGLDIESSDDHVYSCKPCEDVFHRKCIMSMVKREATREEKQIKDIYLMIIDRDVYNMIAQEEIEEISYYVSDIEEIEEESYMNNPFTWPVGVDMDGIGW